MHDDLLTPEHIIVQYSYTQTVLVINTLEIVKCKI